MLNKVVFKRMYKLFIGLLLSMNSIIVNGAEIGTWNSYMAYHDITDIQEAGNILFVLASNNLYSYNKNDHSIQTYSKSNFLSDCGIEHIAYCQAAKRLIITYDRYAYLSTGFGIIKINATKAEISDTYNLGFNVNYCYIQNNKIYAASNTHGLYEASLSNNLLDKSNWNWIGAYKQKNNPIDAELLKLVNTLNPGGPKNNLFGFLNFKNNQLYTCCGGYGEGYDLHRDAAIKVMKDGEWTTYEDS